MTDKTHPGLPTKWLLDRTRNWPKYIDDCKTGYWNAKKRYRQVHHIIPVGCLSDAAIHERITEEEKFKFIIYCLMKTKWDMNEAKNCIGLPLKAAFGYKAAPSGWDGLPCHQVDHSPKYNDEVSTDLKVKIWDPTIRAGEKCNFEPNSLLSALQIRRDRWRTELGTRGTRGKGTKYHWDNREKLDDWYVPFSMSANPSPRKAPKDWENFKRNMQKHLKDIFTKLKG